MKRLLLFFVLLISIQPNSIEARQIENGYDVIEAMYDKYQGKWYKHLTFTQKTSFYGQDGNVARTQDWYEALTLPGKLAIRFDTKDSNNGILFNDGIQYGYVDGAMIQEAERVHELLVLGFDVYHQSPDITATQLTGLGFDLEQMYEDEWQGRKVYVIGVNEPDTTVPQFWIDKERLYFVRNYTIGRQNTIQEVQFNKYERLGQGWIAPEVIFKANGFLGLLEEYTQIVIPDSLNPEIFNPVVFPEVVWD
ncbi:MAG: outer membrane lipoprotein-sorting protein [Balneola sp.]